MNRLISIVILAAGVVLIIYGISASHSFSSDVSRTLTGSPTDKTMWLFGGGAILAVVGGFGLFGRSK